MCRSMFSEKSGFWGLGVASLALLACAAPNDAHITKLSKSRGGDELARPTPVLATLLSYDVVAPRERAALLVEYCQRTKLAVASEAGITRCGPFLSRYEAALIAGLVPGGSTRVHDQYLDGATLEPWLRAIARHKLTDYLRRRGLHDHVDIDDCMDAPEMAVGADSSTAMDTRRLLAELPVRQRRIVEEISLEGRRAADVAVRLGMSEGAVRVSLHRALKTLAIAFRRD